MAKREKSEDLSEEATLMVALRDAKKHTMLYYIKALVKYGASDLHLKPSKPAAFRINGRLVLTKMELLHATDVEKIIFELLNEKQKQKLQEKLQLDFSFYYEGLGRFRCNVFYQKGTLSAVVRMIPLIHKSMDHLGLPPVLKELCHRQRGLILVTGETGSGKSTTLASMVQYINETRPVHIITIEDPIEYIYQDQKASITQRELGSDTHSFKEALTAGLRQDPDVILVGEMRDADTIHTAIMAAETGHLVFSTLHTMDAKGTVDRILDFFEAPTRQQVRMQLSSNLLAVVSQRLILKADQSDRVPACEVLIKSPTIENCIMNNELEKITTIIESSTAYYKMQTFNQDLYRLVKSGLITEEEAIRGSNNPDDLRLSLSGIDREK